jgi:hypothetical protein
MKSVSRMWKLELQEELKIRRRQLTEISEIVSGGLFSIWKNRERLKQLVKMEDVNIE